MFYLHTPYIYLQKHNQLFPPGKTEDCVVIINKFEEYSFVHLIV